MPDTELLERYLFNEDEQAFEDLLARHARMVMGLCRRILRDEQLAEDAFQATFLTLARKAATLTQKSSLASWLYTVAFRLALRARDRKQREVTDHSGLEALGVAADDAVERLELHDIIDEEIRRLPEKHRVPLILCYLEGKTNAEAAQEMACAKGTVGSRLARARSTLRQRLIGRGFEVSLPALGTLPCSSPTPAAVANSIQKTLGTLKSGTVSANIDYLLRGIGMSSGYKTPIVIALSLSLCFGLLGLARWFSPTVAAKAASLPLGQLKLRPGEGLIGRTKEGGRERDLVFRYHHGKVFHSKLLFPKFGKPPRKQRLEITFTGVLELTKPRTVHIYHCGGSSSGGHTALWLGEKYLGKLGDDLPKNAIYKLKLDKGVHQVRWVLTGGYFGCARLAFEDEQGQLLPLRFTAKDLKGLEKVPSKDVVPVRSEERGWPVRRDR